MANSVPKASCCYPDRYSVAVSSKVLRENAEEAFSLHPNTCCAALQCVVEKILFCPLSCCLQGYSHSSSQTIFGSVEQMPFPGQMGQFSESAKKVKICQEKAICIACTLPAIPSMCLGLLGRATLIKTRPFVQVIQRQDFVSLPPPEMTFENPGHFATLNLACPPNCARIAQDITPAKARARYTALAILNDPLAACLYCLQEDWDRDAMEIFSSIVSEKYIVIHSMAPAIGGMSASSAFLSRYPILDLHYHKLSHMVKGHELPPRGIVSVTIMTKTGLLAFYNFHMQSNDGESEARARAKQFEDLGTIMEADRKKTPGLLQIAMGDGNSPPLDMWGRKNDDQMEGQALRALDKVLHQPFFEDHNRITGERTQGHPYFLMSDNFRMLFGEPPQMDFPLPNELMNQVFSFFYPEPTASWYLGPFYPLPQPMNEALEKERVANGYPSPQLVKGKAIRAKTWGSDTWFDEQPLETAIFEVVGVPKQSSLKARVEIRRHVTTRQVGPLSDHAIKQGRFWVEPSKPNDLKTTR